MTLRLIDLMCERHRQQTLRTRMWAHEYDTTCYSCAGEKAVIFPGIDARMEMAVHEAGHAISYLRDSIHVQAVDLGGLDEFAAYTRTDNHYLCSLPGLTGLWAGPAAVRSWLDRSDLLDPAMEIDVAMTSRTDTAKIATCGDGDLIEEARDRADRLVERRSCAIERVADALLSRGRLDGAEIAALAGIRATCTSSTGQPRTPPRGLPAYAVEPYNTDGYC